jgi:uncharacterized RDD family membrane protein YckC
VAGLDAMRSASWPRRILALFVDWIISTLVVIAFLGLDEYAATGSPGPLYVLGVYVVESTIFSWLLGGSFGKLATGLRLVPADGPARPLNPLLLLVRQVMVALVIPPLVFRSEDGRGLHDLLAGTRTVVRG